MDTVGAGAQDTSLCFFLLPPPRVPPCLLGNHLSWPWGPTLWGCKAQPPPLAHEGPSRSCRSPKSARLQAHNQPQGPAPLSHPSPSSQCPLCCVAHRISEASSGSPSALPAALRSSSWAWGPLGLLDLFATSGHSYIAVCFLFNQTHQAKVSWLWGCREESGGAPVILLGAQELWSSWLVLGRQQALALLVASLGMFLPVCLLGG